MIFFKYILTAHFFVFFYSDVSAQTLMAKVIAETGCLPIRVGYSYNLDSLAVVWQIPVEQLAKVNRDLSKVNGNEALVNMPLTGKMEVKECTGCTAIIHKVQKGEGLYRIGLWYGIKNATTLKQLNNLRSEALQPGQELIVGFIGDGFLKPYPLVKGEILLIENEEKDLGKGSGIMPAKADSSISHFKSVRQEVRMDTPILKYEGDGAYETEYKHEGEKSTRKKMKTATFKSQRGWEDGRFYVLSNQIRTGVVVKVINPISGTYLYAKVVGPMPDIKQNHGLHLRISNAAAFKLGYLTEDEDMELDLSY